MLNNRKMEKILSSRFLTILLCGSLGVGVVPLSVAAQTGEAIAPLSTQSSSPTLEPSLVFPDLPPIQPTLPEAPAAVRVVLRLGQRRVYVYQGETVRASYPVAVGKSGWETPTGSFQVISMLEHPAWISPWTGEVIPAGPNSPLGERWIAFWTDGRDYIGFHGTPNRSSVGQAASHGCVRMYNEHIRELYTLVSMGTPVIVQQ